MKNLLASFALSLAAFASAGVAIAADDVTLVGTSPKAPIGPGRVRVTARFTPNAIVAGSSTTFSWSTVGGASFCDITGVPGLDSGGPNGSFTLSPTTNLQAHVSCEGSDDGLGGMANATLTVQPGNTPPVVTASFTPAAIYAGHSSTFSWSSQYATSCSSTGAVSVNATAGSQVLTPTTNQSVTVTCTGPGGQTSASANLSVSAAPPPPPQVYASASPSWLYSPAWVWIDWSSINATSCARGGPFGSYMIYVSFTTAEWVYCYGPGGTGAAVVWIYLTPHAYQSAANEATKATAPDIRDLGIDLSSAEFSYARTDVNGDGQDDLLVVNSDTREAYLLLGVAGRFPVISK
ncbi:MAG: hypothetical protein ABIO49_16565, partial [Dokdonella sp.]